MPISIISSSTWLGIVKTAILIFAFYIFSISLTFFNKKYIMIYPFPLSITVYHLIIKLLLAGSIRWVYECISHSSRVTLSWTEFVRKIAPTGIASAMDIGLSNWSFKFITISLYTMTKSSSIVFILFFAIILRLEKARWSIVMVVTLVSVGLFMFTYKSAQFHLEGFILVLTASFISGIRWTLAQLVTQKKELGLQNPVDMMYHVQPWMIVGLLPLSLFLEGVDLVYSEQFFASPDRLALLQNVAILTIGALLAFFLECSEYMLISHTSSLTLSVAGIFKEVCTLFLAHLVHHDMMNKVNLIGLGISLMGISLHVYFKYKQNTVECENVTNVAYSQLPMQETPTGQKSLSSSN